MASSAASLLHESASHLESDTERVDVEAPIEKNNDDKNDDPIPDGGLHAWLVVLASFLIHGVTFGTQYAWGIFIAYLLAHDFAGRASAAELSLVGTVGLATVFLGGIVTGPLAKSVGVRPLVVAAAVILPVSLVLAAFATEVWQLVLTQGFLFGLGSALAYYPTVAVVAQWWDKRRSRAVGIAMAGSGVGAVALAWAAESMLSAYGRRTTTLATAATVAVCMAIAVFTVRERIPPAKAAHGTPFRIPFDFGPLRDLRFRWLLGGLFMIPFGALVPPFFLPAYVDYLGLDSTWGPTLINVLNGTSIAGRILVGVAADHVGNFTAMAVTSTVAGLSCLSWLFCASPGSLIVMAAIFGFADGGYVSNFFLFRNCFLTIFWIRRITLQPGCAAQIFGLENLAGTVGLVYAALAIGHFASGPIAGLLVHSSVSPHGSGGVAAAGYTLPIAYAGIMATLGAIALVYLRVVIFGPGSLRR
ncbi:major facilitator superfamily domain-containing protein [Blastocladiella britannica]|nr:major facilitator superfamily domain-containing protein [Blastocladiella britannica]